jgi:hypothetical protein
MVASRPVMFVSVGIQVANTRARDKWAYAREPLAERQPGPAASCGRLNGSWMCRGRMIHVIGGAP